ncbi:MAG: cation-translocating P-type ATPase [Deltaproteobacteria bacterium]|nr:cation-translocating P-type ATPase [Deltaproteobacteria bacterium]
MLITAGGIDDPAHFRDTDLFKRCRDLGIIPASESDLQLREQSPEKPIAAAVGGGKTHGSEALSSSDQSNRLDLLLRIDGMWCPACAWLIDASLKKLPGVLRSGCNFSTDRLRCVYDPVLTSPDRIIAFIERLGYHAALPGDGGRAKEKRRETIRFAVSTFLTMNVMMISFALYSGFFSSLSPDAVAYLSWPIFIMASVVMAYGGKFILVKAVAGFSNAAFSMETLIAIGASSAYLYSVFNLSRGNIHLYFDTASMLITLVLLGKLLERNAKEKVLEDLEAFFTLKPTKVKLCSREHPQGRYVSAEYLRKDDLFLIDDGEIAPADGMVIDGDGLVDESSLTGEARPMSKRSGSSIRSGTRVSRGHFKVKALAVGEDSTLGQMMRIIEQTLTQKTTFEGKTDRLLKGFVPLIILLSIGTAIFGFLVGLDPGDALIRAVTVLVISCPCALGVAIPLARTAGISVAGRNGILVRDFTAFERARRIDTFVFDKTGTLTEGRWRLLAVRSLSAIPADRLVALAVGLEEESDHHVAVELKRWAGECGIAPAVVTDIRTEPNGISGRVGEETVKIGSAAFLAAEIAAAAPVAEIDARDFDTEPTPVYMSAGGRLCARLIFGDTIKSGVRETVAELKALGYGLAVVSGDEAAVTQRISKSLGIDDAHGALLPAGKAAFLASRRKDGRRPAMVGDGINDALAMAEAELAIAVHSGSHLGKEVADITLMRGDPEQVLVFLRLAEETNRKILQNLWFSFVYNFTSIPLAMSGLLTPPTAVCAMLLSSLTVIGNTLLLVRSRTGR